ncbi:MAG: energy-coupling factor transporter transmembrane component T [Anaerolineales bacterium]|jgi:energy-coupling factor transport system permease protein|nr:energy-coupling factor transporter transmembrane component T [Anaerolineales bacterium]
MTASPTPSHSGTLYQPGASFLHRLHPLTKLTFSLCALVVIFSGPGGWLSALLPGLLALSLLWRAGLGRLAARLSFRLLAWLAVIMFGIHGFFGPDNQTILFNLGPLEVGQEGIEFAFLITIRLAAMLLVSLTLVLTTHPSHLVQALTEFGLPGGLAYLLGSPLLLLPQMVVRAQAIHAVQQARGLETQGNLLQRMRALFPLVAPLVFSTLVDVEERSLALEVRGFSAPTRKTFLNELVDTRSQRLARRGLIALSIVTFLLGVGWRLYASS